MAAGAFVFLFCLFTAFGEFFGPIRLPAYVTCLVIWVVGLVLFVAQCYRLSGWIQAFLRHQVHGILAAMGNAVVVFAALCAGWILGATTESPPCILFVAIGVGVVAVWLLRPMRWFSRQATGELDALVEQIINDEKVPTEP